MVHPMGTIGQMVINMRYILIILLLFSQVALAGSAKKVISCYNAAGGSAGCSGTYGLTTTEEAFIFDSNYDYFLRKITLDCSGTAGDLYVYLRQSVSSTTEVNYACYNDGGSGPTTLAITGTTKYGSGATEWLADTATDYTLPAGTYWCGVQIESAAIEVIKDLTDDYTNGSAFCGDTDFILDNDLTGCGTGNYDLQIYLSY